MRIGKSAGIFGAYLTQEDISLMMDQVKALNEAGVHAAYINSSLTENQIAKALELLPKVIICYDDFRDNVSSLARRMYVDPDKLPLIIVTKPGLNGIFATSGYNVGMGDLLIKILSE